MERGNAVLEANDHVEHLIGKRTPPPAILVRRPDGVKRKVGRFIIGAVDDGDELDP